MDVVPPGNWPQYGRVCFRDVSMRYRLNTPLVFSRLSFDIHENEKIGEYLLQSCIYKCTIIPKITCVISACVFVHSCIYVRMYYKSRNYLCYSVFPQLE